MRSGELTSSPAKLLKAWKKLFVQWEQTKSDWNDRVSFEFEEKHLMKLEAQLLATREAMLAMASVVGTAEQEVDRSR